jgi:hypothetical protein
MTGHSPATVSGADPLGAVIVQLASHAEQISSLDGREDARHGALSAEVRQLASGLAEARRRLDQIDALLSGQAAVTASLDSLDKQISALAAQLSDLTSDDKNGPGARYQPAPAPRWWRQAGPDLDAAAGRLRAWTEQIYLPCYGRLAATLPPCWEAHPACLFILDWLSELWSVLYLSQRRDDRTLAAQAEWHTRLLPAAAELMAAEATGCRHTTASARRAPATAARPRPGGTWPGT